MKRPIEISSTSYICFVFVFVDNGRVLFMLTTMAHISTSSLVMFLSENYSPNFSNKSKSNDIDGLTATKASHDIVEHDVTALARMNNLPATDAFDALHVSSNR
jgi:hypothetical protein